jgi:4-hydroxy-3-polyprenylbenzoate decarboxylase
MAYKSLQDFVDSLIDKGELIQINAFVDPNLEVTEIADRMAKSLHGGKALLFSNNGTAFPLLINAMGSEKRMALALGLDSLNDIEVRMNLFFDIASFLTSSGFQKLRLLLKVKDLSVVFPAHKSGRGVCQDVIHHQPDLGIFPILKCWPHDGGRFITLPLVITRDPHSKIRNLGMYRMQVFDKNTTGMHWHLHKTGARHYREYKRLGLKMPVTVFLGGDPAYTYSATAPLPENIDELMLAGFLRRKKVKLVRCLTNDLEVPEDADVVIEGYVDTSEELAWEGPFGDHTGFYSLPDWYPKFHVTCITHRKDAVFPATIVGIPPQEDAYIAKVTERLFLKPIQLTIAPEVIDIDLPVAGVAHNLVLIKLKSEYKGEELKVMNAFFGAGQMMFAKMLILLPEQIDIHNYSEVARHLSQTVEPKKDIFFTQGPSDVLDHSSLEPAYGGKMALISHPLAESESIISPDIDSILVNIPGSSVDCSLLAENISVVFIYVDSDQILLVDSLEKLIIEEKFGSSKFIILIDSSLQKFDFFSKTWYCLANIDPIRDCKIIGSHLLVNATNKSALFKTAGRNWPNVLTSKAETIDHVDSILQKNLPGEIVDSPSKIYRKLLLPGTFKVFN